MDSVQPVPIPRPQPDGPDIGLILGVVFGVLAVLALTAGFTTYVCYKRKRRALLTTKPLPSPDSSKASDELLQQLKEQEFDCHDIEICVDLDGKEIELGSGGFGRVIKGVRDGVQPVAIKMIFKTDQKAQEEFLKEIKLLKHVSLDANIVQYFGASFQEDQLWLVTEFMEGGDLRKALSADEEHRLTWWNGGKQIALDTARGLAFLHSRHVIHRDIKSHNILLTREGRAKIADVGMAQIMTDDYYASSVNSQQGTFAWASPELLLKEGRCTEKVDIYSFGVCLWEIVTSQMPKRGEMFCPSAEECPAAVTRLIRECMRQHPRDRPSAREIYRRLRVCEPVSEDCEQLILDSAEAGGRGSRVIAKAQQGVRTSYRLEPAPETGPMHHPFAYDSPMSTHQEAIKAGTVAKLDVETATCSESPLPTSNAAFTQLVAKYNQPSSASLPAAGFNPSEDIMATGSVDADLSHIPSVHGSMTQDRIRLPDFLLTTNDSRFMDFNQTQSSDELFGARNALSLTNYSLTLPAGFSMTQSSDELYAARIGLISPGRDLAAKSDSEAEDDTDTTGVAVASVQGYAGSSRADSRLNTGSAATSLNTGSSERSEEQMGCIPDKTGILPGEDSEASTLTTAAPPRIHVSPLLRASSVYTNTSIHTGTSSIHTGSTACYEDAEEMQVWLKPEGIDATDNPLGESLFNINVNMHDN